MEPPPGCILPKEIIVFHWQRRDMFCDLQQLEVWKQTMFLGRFKAYMYLVWCCWHVSMYVIKKYIQISQAGLQNWNEFALYLVLATFGTHHLQLLHSEEIETNKHASFYITERDHIYIYAIKTNIYIYIHILYRNFNSKTFPRGLECGRHGFWHRQHGARWFGILGVPLGNTPLRKEIPGIQTTNPNRQLTIS